MIKQVRVALKFLPLALLLGLPLLLSQPATAEPAKLLSPQVGPNWASIIPLTNLGNAPQGAERPVVAAAPDGKTVTVAYIKLTAGAGDADPFYRRSTNNGVTWSDAAAIKDTTTLARQVHVTYDAGNRAHAVWTEAGNIVAYARDNNWGGAAYTPISSGLILVEGPRIATSGSNRLDLVWAENDGADPDIYHAFSTNGNAATPTWSTPKIVHSTAPASTSPDIAVSANGHIHVVWEEQNPSNPTVARVHYARSIDGGANWSGQVIISGASNPTDARRPRIVAAGNVLHVSFTDRESGSSQFVHHLSCISNCHNLASWMSDGKVSGSAVGIHANDPSNSIFSTLTTHGGCTLIYFYGIGASVDPSNEMVWGSSSCGSWSSRVLLTGPGARAIRPSMTTQNNWWVYLAYERIAADRSHIWFVRNQPAVYLPFVVRN